MGKDRFYFEKRVDALEFYLTALSLRVWAEWVSYDGAFYIVDIDKEVTFAKS